MRFFSLVLLFAAAADAFVIKRNAAPARVSALNGYVPDGMSKEQWAKIQAKEKTKVLDLCPLVQPQD